MYKKICPMLMIHYTVQSRLSGLAGDQKVHYHACTEGMASDLLWVWSQVER